MESNKKKLHQKMEHFKDSCREAGLKVTHQRLEIFRALASSTDHPTAEMLYQRLHHSMPTLSLDTVYRTLTTFEMHELISRVHTTESYARFEAEMIAHHHAICSRCHKITDFHWDICDTNQVPEVIADWGKIDSKQITLKGICEGCARG